MINLKTQETKRAGRIVKMNSMEPIGVLKNKIVFHSLEGRYYVDIQSILYFQAKGSYTKVFFTDGSSLVTSRTLKSYEKRLSNCQQFVRVHRSYMISITGVKKYAPKRSGVVELENGEELYVSEGYQGAFQSRMDEVCY